jgi:hypothetical protein
MTSLLKDAREWLSYGDGSLGKTFKIPLKAFET